MIAGIFHDGSGLGNQLHRYIFVRCLAADKGWEWGMKNPEKFKGWFLPIDMGKPYENLPNNFLEARQNHTDGITDIRGFDDTIFKIQDNTLIDGEFQEEKYWANHKEDIRKWLGLKENPLPENVCVINVRGGEYRTNTLLVLEQSYWNYAVEHMRKIRPDMLFKVVTDDIEWAKGFFPDFEVSHEFSNDWLSIYNATYLILSNSSFAVLPAWLNRQVRKIIVPMYWARHHSSNGFWALKQNCYNGWDYQDTKGNLHVFQNKTNLKTGISI